jgi:hypothetical protein
VEQTKADFLETQAQSKQILLEKMEKKTRHNILPRDLYYAVLRLFAPLL